MRPVVFLFVLMFWRLTCLADGLHDCQDGQTCHLQSEAYTGPVRLFCIQAPVGKVAWAREARLALNQEVHGVIRVLMAHQDRDGVPVAEMIREDGWNLGLEQVRAGLARVPPEGCDDPLYPAAQTSAQAANQGIWSSATLACPGPRFCKGVAHCAAAYHYLTHCGRRDFDRDEDGIPCESICGEGR